MKEIIVPTYKTLKDLYKEFITPNVESIKKTLMQCYGGERHEFTVVKSSSFLTWLESNDKGSEAKNREFLKRCVRGVEGDSYRRSTAYRIMIHYPELTVKNSHRGSQKITDMYIKITLSPFLNDAEQGYLFSGCRTSYTLAEYTSGYNFSHLSGSAGTQSFTSFCLGETPFSTLCRSLAMEFNANFFGLFCYQLEGYLSWESLEGGPYRRFENIHERGHHSTVSISSGDKGKYYKNFLASDFTPTMVVKSNPFCYTLEVVQDDEFMKALTKCVDNPSHLQFWDSERKTASDMALVNRRAAVEEILVRHRNTVFKFNDKDVKIQITDASTKEEKDDKVKVAHQQIVHHVVNSINRSILQNIKNGFSQKRRVYAIR